MGAPRVVGIDLGTTYSCISYIDEYGKPTMIPDLDGDMTTPSVVYFESGGNIVVGKEAKNLSMIYPERVAAMAKRSMGTPGAVIETDGQAYTPEMISSLVLRQLVLQAERALDERVTDVVITCPAYFGINERTAVENAGKLAGLRVRYILSEPTAAAIHYGLSRVTEDQVVLVYDLGGGTFDVSVIAIEKGDIRVICTGGDHNLGGKDWDNRITEYSVKEFLAKQPAFGDPRDDSHARQRIAIEAEVTKKSLSSKEKSTMPVACGSESMLVEITRVKLEELTADLFDRTIEIVRRVVQEASGLGFKTIDRVFLVGGLSKMPVVARRLKEVLNVDPLLVDPDLAVAKGAAQMGLIIETEELIREVIATAKGVDPSEVDLRKEDVKTILAAAQAAREKSDRLNVMSSEQLVKVATRRVTNVCSRAFGIVVWDKPSHSEQVSHLIHRNAALPAEVSDEYYTNAPNQTSVPIVVMEQAGETESDQMEHNKEIGRGIITGLPSGLPEGAPIQVTMRLAEDGLLECAALHASSGKVLRLSIVTENAMSPAEVESGRAMLMSKNVRGEVS